MSTYTYKVKLSSNWSSSEEITKRLLTQFQTCDSDLFDIEFVHNNNYDLHVVFGYISDYIDDTKPTFVFPQEPSWSGGHPKFFNDYKNVKVFGFDKNNYNPQECVVETIAHMFYGGRGPWEEGYDFWNYYNLTKNSFEKTKDFCSFISNRGINDESHPIGCLYGDRISLVKELIEKTDYIDFYGWGSIGNLKPFSPKKYEAIKDYKFCLTVENSCEKNYISEKFYDCVLTNTIPIYYGCNNIKEFWLDDFYILLDNIKNHKYVLDKLEFINQNKDEIYNSMLPKLIESKKKYFEEFNLLKKIKKEFYEI